MAAADSPRMRSSFEAHTPGKSSSAASTPGPGNATTSCPPISIRVPSSAASASFTRPACANETSSDKTAQTAASNGVPQQTGRRPPASASNRPMTGSRSPTTANPLDVQR